MKISLLALAAAIGVATPGMATAPAFDTPAPIGYMIDLSSNAVLFSRNADMRIPPASMAKMMTVYVVFDMIQHGELRASQTYPVRPETWRAWHAQGSTMFLAVNENVSVDNLLKGIVTLSGNDACVVLAEGISGTEQAFTERMNRTAQRLGLTNSHFGTSNGWPDGGETYVTARDLATLAAATIRDFPDLYHRYYALPSFTWGHQMNGAAIDQNNRDPLLGHVQGADGLKTGHTDEAGYGFTGSAIQNGRRLVMVVAKLDTYNQRAAESVRFMEWGFRAWQGQPVVARGRQVGTAAVQMGDAGEVGLVAPSALNLTVPAGTHPALEGRIVYEGPVHAPIRAGQHIADLIVQSPDIGRQSFPLVAANDVGTAGFFRRAWHGFTGMFGA